VQSVYLIELTNTYYQYNVLFFEGINVAVFFFFFFSSRRRHTRFDCDWSSDVCSSDLREKPPWATALKFGPQILRRVIDAGVPKNTVINVNFPACAPDDVKGIRVTRQGTRNLGFLKVDQRRDGRGNPYFWIGFERAAMM